ncbi:hypothetical protein CKO_04476 [Citrobacter koseri ATCC BAA-895]|uniref:Uncharacterized protein n=1 Tax=Citrobacter koseri (strain ATCC BAA-895 / CDC 4225-83 / SGSC4696) TaxID=290338 RepID=A8APW8_CITK8|nr:hypothetical protein CKO_04476 [Citrobacter koseri ATCC BAA-895]
MHYEKAERIGIAILPFFRVYCSTMKRDEFFCVPFQNKKRKDFFGDASSYSDCIAPVSLRFRH